MGVYHGEMSADFISYSVVEQIINKYGFFLEIFVLNFSIKKPDLALIEIINIPLDKIWVYL